MRSAVFAALMASSFGAWAGDCRDQAPSYAPVATTFSQNCSPGQVIVDRQQGKSPVVKFNFSHAQEVTITTHSGARSGGGNGRGAQVCIWQSWSPSTPCGRSDVSADGFNDWDGRASCSVVVPAGEQYVRALQTNSNADELNTTIRVTCR